MKSKAKFFTCVGSVACLFSILAATKLFGQTLDDAFNPDVTGGQGEVFTTLEQSTGQILVGGDFTSIAGGARTNLARLNHNGTLDVAFTANANGNVRGFAEQADGKILLCGAFSKLAGQTRNGIARLNPDGSLDTDFHPAVLYSPNPSSTSVIGLALQTDGKILIGGFFTSVTGQPRANLARLSSDGSLDANFTNGTGGTVYDVKVLANAKVMVAGAFDTLAGQTRHGIGRLNADGSFDGSFTTPYPAANILGMQVQADSKILINGFSLYSITGQVQNAVGRLNSDGSVDTDFRPHLDTGFAPFQPEPYGYCLALQPDGKILVGGLFANPGTNLTRLLPDGSVDATFHASAERDVRTLTIQRDGNILVGGDFNTLDGITRHNLGRFFPDSPRRRSPSRPCKPTESLALAFPIPTGPPSQS
jgi:uncharacterized delta-60 repeat protein